MNSKKYLWITSILTFALLTIGAAFIIIIDPYFHFHKPSDNIPFHLSNQRYITDGIVSNFEYNALMTGTSMTENFKKSDMDEIFGVNSIKVPLAGASFKEIDEILKKAINENDELKVIVRGLDFINFSHEKDYMEYDEKTYPKYLSDNNPFNDYEYILNKEILFEYLNTPLEYFVSNFDDYSRWAHAYEFSKAAALATYERPANIAQTNRIFTPEHKLLAEDNVRYNVVETAKANPQVNFYCFIPPYSILYFDREFREGRLDFNLKAGEAAIALLLDVPNIKLFSFFDNYELICDLNNYKDPIHYSSEINKQILKWMRDGEYQLTKENYQEHLQEMRDFYFSYDYNSIFN